MLAALLQNAPRKRSAVMALFRHLGAFGLFSLAVLDSSPLPTLGGPDILIVILVATRDHPWYEFAAVAAVGSVLGAYLTFRLARRAGRAYLDDKFGRRRVPKLLDCFERYGTGALIASTAIPFPFPTSVFFAAAGASRNYDLRKFLGIVFVGRAVRYTAVALIAHVYGRHIIRVLRHPGEHWLWLMAFAGAIVAVAVAGFLVQRQIQNSGDWSTRHVPQV